MKKLHKRILSALLAMVLVFSVFPVNVLSAEEITNVPMPIVEETVVPETTEATVSETTVATVPETTVATVPETTVATVPETTETTVPETTETTVPETTETTVPEITEATVPETTAATEPTVEVMDAVKNEALSATVDYCAYCEESVAEDGSVIHAEGCYTLYEVDASGDVGKYVKMANPELGMHVLDTADDFNISCAVSLYGTDFDSEPVFLIKDWHWDVKTTALWYRVELYSGAVLEESAEFWPAEPWILQDYTDPNYEYDAALAFTEIEEPEKPETGAPTSIVSSGGITVSLDRALLTGLTVTEIQAPAVSYINRAIAYDMTPVTAEGNYTGYAEVTIPIPEGWDTGKLFGFLVEADGSVTAISGTVTPYGTFRFTVPHFSTVGLLEATAVEEVINKTVCFGKMQTENQVPLSGWRGTPDRYVSEDGAVQYVISHVTLADSAQYTYVSITGLDVTPGTEIMIGDTTAIIVIVEPLENEVTKLLTGGNVANSLTLDPLFDVGISGEFPIEYEITSGGDNLILDVATHTITAVDGANGTATVKATIQHPTSGNVVGTVIYNVTVSQLEVTASAKIHAPVGGTSTIYSTSGELVTDMLDTTIATASLSGSTLSVTGVATGITSVVVGTVLYEIYVHPDNAGNTSSKYVYISIGTLNNCKLYYAVNGGELIPVTGSTLIQQTYPDGMNVMFFSVPEKNCATTSMSIDGSAGQYYCLSNGSRYDGSDSDAWPFVDANANAVPSDSGDVAWKTGHGFRWSLLQGNMSIAQMRDLFTRALALGADSVTTLTKNDSDNFTTTVSITAESLPTFEKTISKITKVNGTVEEFTPEDPYDPATHPPLEIGDIVTYQFAIDIESTTVTYAFTLSDPSIGYQEELTGIISNRIVEKNYEIGATEGVVDQTKISQYADGRFVNTASLTYTYQSDVASGKSETTATSTATCRISSIVTWKDNTGKVWQVLNVPQGNVLSKANAPAATRDYYTFDGWVYDGVSGLTKQDDGTYQVDYGAESTITILGSFTPVPYTITYETQGGTLSSGAADENHQKTYTYEDVLTIPAPTKPGFTFDGWKATYAVGDTGRWVSDQVYTAGTVLTHWYGNVTLTAQWTPVTYSITYKPDGGTLAADSPQTYTAEDTLTIASPVKNGWAFAGWTVTSSDDGEDNWENSYSSVHGLTGMYGNVTLTANWKQEVTFRATIDNNGTITRSDTGETGAFTETVAAGAYQNVTVTCTPAEGYHITRVTVNGVEQSLTTNKHYIYTVPDTGLTEDAVIVVETSDQYTVTYLLDSGDTTPYATATAKADDEVKLIAKPNIFDPALEKRLAFLVFSKWNADVDGDLTEEAYDPGNTFTMPDRDITVVASWTDATVRIGINMSFYTNGNSFYYSLPKDDEPFSGDTNCARAYKNNQSVWCIEKGNWETGIGNAKDIVKSSVLSNWYVNEKHKSAKGIFSETGVQGYVNFNDYDGIIGAWKTECTGTGPGKLFTNYSITLDWAVAPTLNYEAIPYVIKRQDNGHWYLDMLIRPTDRYNVTYDVSTLDNAYGPVETPVDDHQYGYGFPVIAKTVSDVPKIDDANHKARLKAWFVDADNDKTRDENETVYTPGAEFSMPNGPVRLTAEWIYPVEYSIEYLKKNPNDATPDDATDDYEKQDEDTQSNLIGYPGDVLNITKTYTGYQLSNSNPQPFTVPVDGGVIQVKYDPITYQVIFHGPEGSTNVEQTLTYDKVEVLTKNTFKKEGYVFAGWSVAENSEVKAYDDQQKINGEDGIGNLADTQDEKVDLYAIFKPILLTIRLSGADSGVYYVKKGNDVISTVILHDGEQKTLEQVPVEATVETAGNWDWTYTSKITWEGAGQTYVLEQENNVVNINRVDNNREWLYGGCCD